MRDITEIRADIKLVQEKIVSIPDHQIIERVELRFKLMNLLSEENEILTIKILKQAI